MGGSLYLSGTAITGAVYDCGNEKRAAVAYQHPEKGRVVSLGCFVGTEAEAISAIYAKYGDTEAGNAYIAKVKQALAYKSESK